MPAVQLPGFNLAFNPGKVKTKTQMCLLITNYGDVVAKELPTFLQLALDHKEKKAYLMDWDEQLMGEDGAMYQVIYEKSSLPVCFTGDPEVKIEELDGVIDKMFEDSFQVKMTEDINNANRDGTWDKIMIIISIVCATILIIAFMQWRSGG